LSKRILIIDDEENIRRVMRLTLEAAGYEVSEAGDGMSGLESFSDGETWDAVLLDQRMPGMDGLETLHQIKLRQPDARVIMATAYASIELAVDAMKLGALDFVRKPMTPEILRNAVEAALSKTVLAEPARSRPSGERNSEHPQSLIQYVTMNGFSFVLASDVKGRSPAESNKRRFIVTTPRGLEQEVTVEIDPEAVAYVERMTRRRLPAESSFWTIQASRFLSAFLWNEGHAPSSGKRLVLKDIDRDELPIAERWDS
jgi:DNA-binding response OmpR family regulator